MLTVRPEVKIAALALLGLSFAIGYFTHFPLPAVGEKLFLLNATLLILFSAYGYGSTTLSRARPASLDVYEYVLFATVLGLGVWSLLLYIAGVFGGWTKPAVLVLLAAGIYLGWNERAHLRTVLLSEKEKGRRPLIPVLLIGLGALLSLLIAFAPPTYYDTLVYHYALPQSYLKAGRWVGETSLIYSAFPQTMEMLWLLGFVIEGDILANLIGWSVAAIGVYAVYRYAKRYLDTKTAWWASAMVAVMPSYMLLASGGYIDVGLTVFGFCSFYLLSLWAEERHNSLLFYAGMLSSFALGSKYTGAIGIGLCILFILKQLGLKEFKNALLSTLIYASTTAIFFLPWMLKNLHFVGNPVFPFLYKWGGTASPWVKAAAEGYFRGLTEYTPRSFFGLGKLVWEIAVGGLNFGGGMDILGDLGWGALLGFLPILWIAKKPSAILNCMLYALFFFIPWGLTRPVLRFLFPLVPFLALLSAHAYCQGISSTPKWFKNGAHVFLAVLLCSNIELFFDASNALTLFQVPLGFSSRTEFLEKRLKYFRAASVVSGLPADSLTYVVGDQCGYYYNKRVSVTPVFNANPLAEWTNNASSAQDLATELRSRGITHLLINRTELYRLNAAYGIFLLNDKGLANWQGLLEKWMKPLFKDQHCEVYEFV